MDKILKDEVANPWRKHATRREYWQDIEAKLEAVLRVVQEQESRPERKQSQHALD